jgi:hypothetical protein
VHSTTYYRTAYHNPFAHTDPRNLRSDLEGNSSVSFNSFDIACSGGSVWIPKLTTGLSSSSRTITASPEIPSERGGGHSSSSKAKKNGAYRPCGGVRRRTQADRAGRHVGNDAGVDGSETSVDQGDGRAGR